LCFVCYCGELLVRTGRVVLSARLVAMLLGGFGDLAVAVDDGGALAEGDRLARLALFLYFDVRQPAGLSSDSFECARGALTISAMIAVVYLVRRMRLVVYRRRVYRLRVWLLVTQKLLQGQLTNDAARILVLACQRND
jgi:hypothetical protein